MLKDFTALQNASDASLATARAALGTKVPRTVDPEGGAKEQAAYFFHPICFSMLVQSSVKMDALCTYATCIKVIQVFTLCCYRKMTKLHNSCDKSEAEACQTIGGGMETRRIEDGASHLRLNIQSQPDKQHNRDFPGQGIEKLLLDKQWDCQRLASAASFLDIKEHEQLLKGEFLYSFPQCQQAIKSCAPLHCFALPLITQVIKPLASWLGAYKSIKLQKDMLPASSMFPVSSMVKVADGIGSADCEAQPGSRHKKSAGHTQCDSLQCESLRGVSGMMDAKSMSMRKSFTMHAESHPRYASSSG
eukprot:1157270-Pelagomonas_calceolata.AAC.3